MQIDYSLNTHFTLDTNQCAESFRLPLPPFPTPSPSRVSPYMVSGSAHCAGADVTSCGNRRHRVRTRA